MGIRFPMWLEISPNAPSASNLLPVDLPPDLQRNTSFNCAASVLSGASNEAQFVPLLENLEITLPEIPGHPYRKSLEIPRGVSS